MGTLTLMEKGTSCEESIDFPAFYMNDFSVLGLVVEDLVTVLTLLQAHGYQVAQKRCSAKVRTENRDHYKNLFSILEKHQVEFTTSDLVRCAYQG